MSPESLSIDVIVTKNSRNYLFLYPQHTEHDLKIMMLMKARLNIVNNLLIITDRRDPSWKAFRQNNNFMYRRRGYQKLL